MTVFLICICALVLSMLVFSASARRTWSEPEYSILDIFFIACAWDSGRYFRENYEVTSSIAYVPIVLVVLAVCYAYFRWSRATMRRHWIVGSWVESKK